MSVVFGFDTRNVTGSAVTDKITDVDNGSIIYYSTDADCTVTVDGSIGMGFHCKAIVHNSSIGLPIFSGGSFQNRYGKYKANGPGAVIDIYAPGDGNIAISGDLGQVSTLFDDLPASPQIGDTAICSDVDTTQAQIFANAVTVGGGSKTCILFWDGSDWRVMGGRP